MARGARRGLGRSAAEVLKLRIHRDAKRELRAAATWYEARREGLGVELVMAVDKAIDRIVEAPDRYPPFRSNRRYVLERFPYSVIYNATDAELVVKAIAHHRRKPGYWQARR